jgi:hypothetical protein
VETGIAPTVLMDESNSMLATMVGYINWRAEKHANAANKPRKRGRR